MKKFKKLSALACAVFLMAGCGAKKQTKVAAVSPVSTKVVEVNWGEKFRDTIGENNKVLFGYNKSSLSPLATKTLDDQIKWLKNNPTAKVKIIVEGHTDERGTTQYNLALAQRRADAVKSYFVAHGITQRIETTSFGKEKPEAMGHNENAWGRNRRAVVVVIN